MGMFNFGSEQTFDDVGNGGRDGMKYEFLII